MEQWTRNGRGGIYRREGAEGKTDGGDTIEVNSMASRIRQGETDLIPDLWESVYDFVKLRASVAMRNMPGELGVTVDDLIQCGYFALVSAVDTYDEKKGSFLGWLAKYLQHEFAKAGGYSTSKRDALNFSTSLDVPVPGGENADETFADVLPDAKDVYADVEDVIYYQQLHDTLEKSIALLPESQSGVVRERYWHNKKLQEIADELGVSKERIRQKEVEALKRLRRTATVTGLSAYVDDRVSYYSGNGLRSYRERGASSVEYTVMRRERLREEWEAQQKETTEEE